MRSHNLTKIYYSILYFLAIALMAYSFVKLFMTDKKSTDLSSNTIGMIINYNNDVRLKRTSEVQWEQLDQNQIIVNENDAVFTGQASTATVNLDPNSVINIDKETLIRIKANNEIILKEGNINLKLKKNTTPLTLVLGDKRYKLKTQKDSNIKVSQINSHSTILVKVGEIDITDNQLQKSASTGQILELKDEVINIYNEKITLKAPKGDLFFTDITPIEFRYESNIIPSGIEIIHFNKKTLHQLNKQVLLKPGHYKWKLVYDDKNIESPLNEFNIIQLTNAPHLLKPKNNYSIKSYSKNVDVFLQWENRQRNSKLEIIGQNSRITESTLESNFTLPMTNGGKFKWRVKTFDRYIQSNFSEFQNFDIEFLNPSHQTALQFELKRPGQELEFEWKSRQNSTTTFTLSKSSDFSEILYQVETKDNKVKKIIPDVGLYYWKVENSHGITPVKIEIRPSPPPTRAPKIKNKKVIKRLSLPIKTSFLLNQLLFSSAHASNSSNSILIEWEKMEEAKTYEIEIFDQNNNLLKTFTTNTASLEWSPLNYGQYFYRVRYKDFWNRYSPFSSKAEIHIQKLEKTVKKKTQSKPTLVKTIEKKSKEKKLASEVRLSYSYQIIDYEQEDSETYSIDGNSSTGHSLLWKTKNFYLRYFSQYGEVFDKESFTKRKLYLAVNSDIKFFKVFYGMSFLQYSLYEQENNEAGLKSTPLTYSVFAKLETTHFVGKKHNFLPFGKIALGKYSEMAIGLTYRYYLSSVFSLTIEPSISKLILNDADRTITEQYSQLVTGLSAHF